MAHEGEPREGTFCNICLSELGIKPYALPCGHLFHLECVKQSLENKSSCPVCRTSFRGDPNRFLVAIPGLDVGFLLRKALAEAGVPEDERKPGVSDEDEIQELLQKWRALPNKEAKREQLRVQMQSKRIHLEVGATLTRLAEAEEDRNLILASQEDLRQKIAEVNRNKAEEGRKTEEIAQKLDALRSRSVPLELAYDHLSLFLRALRVGQESLDLIEAEVRSKLETTHHLLPSDLARVSIRADPEKVEPRLRLEPPLGPSGSIVQMAIDFMKSLSGRSEPPQGPPRLPLPSMFYRVNPAAETNVIQFSEKLLLQAVLDHRNWVDEYEPYDEARPRRSRLRPVLSYSKGLAFCKVERSDENEALRREYGEANSKLASARQEAGRAGGKLRDIKRKIEWTKQEVFHNEHARVLSLRNRRAALLQEHARLAKKLGLDPGPDPPEPQEEARFLERLKAKRLSEVYYEAEEEEEEEPDSSSKEKRIFPLDQKPAGHEPALRSDSSAAARSSLDERLFSMRRKPREERDLDPAPASAASAGLPLSPRERPEELEMRSSRAREASARRSALRTSVADRKLAELTVGPGPSSSLARFQKQQVRQQEAAESITSLGRRARRDRLRERIASEADPEEEEEEEEEPSFSPLPSRSFRDDPRASGLLSFSNLPSSSSASEDGESSEESDGEGGRPRPQGKDKARVPPRAASAREPESRRPEPRRPDPPPPEPDRRPDDLAWACPKCTYENCAWLRWCELCECPRPGSLAGDRAELGLEASLREQQAILDEARARSPPPEPRRYRDEGAPEQQRRPRAPFNPFALSQASRGGAFPQQSSRGPRTERKRRKPEGSRYRRSSDFSDSGDEYSDSKEDSRDDSEDPDVVALEVRPKESKRSAAPPAAKRARLSPAEPVRVREPRREPRPAPASVIVIDSSSDDAEVPLYPPPPLSESWQDDNDEILDLADSDGLEDGNNELLDPFDSD